VSVTLRWSGPVGVGRFPTDPGGLDALAVPAVYLRLKAYAGGRVVAYAGQSVNLLARIDQHCARLLSFAQPLRDAAGDAWFPATREARFAAYNELEQTLALARAEAERTRFYYAPCDEAFEADLLPLAEAALIVRLREGDAPCENRTGAPIAGLDRRVVFASDMAALDAPNRALLAGLIGEAPLALAPAEAADAD
jgi:hypothetical protein